MGTEIPVDVHPRQKNGPPPVAPGEMLVPGYRVVNFLRRGRDLDTYDLWSEERFCRCVGKTVRPDRLEASDATERLLREGQLLLGLTHPHIVRAYDVMEEPIPLLILETLPGETLAHLIDRRERRLSGGDIAHLGLHLCSAIAYLHRNDILHLDLKPSNIIVTQGMAKVLDLSIARRPGPHRGGIGTRGYRAPEQSLGGELGTFTDVWGIGISLYEVATGESACYRGDEPTASGPESVACQPQPVRRARRLAPELGSAIDRCLSSDPDQRPTVFALAATLEAFIASRLTRQQPAQEMPSGSA